MFRLRKAAQSLKVAVKEAVSFPQENVHEVIEKIHLEFDSAADEALIEAKSILAKTSEFDHQKMELLKKAGFTGNKKLEKAEIERREKERAKEKADIVLKWTTKYPNNKFIFKNQVNAICSKYGLVCGSVDRYVGEVPYKNLLEIDNFKPSEEDIFLVQDGSREDALTSSSWRIINSKEVKHQREDRSNFGVGYNSYTSIPLYICAPAKDMKFEINEKQGNFLIKEYPDPIVLHFVKDGFLIVSKWGLEADDDMGENWHIDEYDGIESVHENHRSW